MEEAAKIPTVFDDEQEHVGEVYANAIFQAAKSAGAADEICEQLVSISNDLIAKNPKFAAILASPRISQDDKLGMLDRVFGSSTHPTLFKFLKVLCMRDRLGFVQSISRAAVKLQDEDQNRVRVIVTTAVEVDENVVSPVEAALKAKLDAELVVEKRVDPAILGGMLIRVGDTVCDGSVAARIESTRKSVAEKTEQSLREKFDQLVAN